MNWKGLRRELRELVQAEEGSTRQRTIAEAKSEDRVFIADREAGNKCIQNEAAK